jgi:hypothetical protein
MAHRLCTLADELRQTIGSDVAAIFSAPLEQTGEHYLEVDPANPRSAGAYVVEGRDGLTVYIGPNGAHWNLGSTDEDWAHAQALVGAALAGDVTERTFVGGSTVDVTLADGTEESLTNYKDSVGRLARLFGGVPRSVIEYDPYRRPIRL